MESTHNYLIYLRMQHCRKALEEGVSVLNACTESGFPDYSSFLKTFRRLYSITPGIPDKSCSSGCRLFRSFFHFPFQIFNRKIQCVLAGEKSGYPVAVFIGKLFADGE